MAQQISCDSCRACCCRLEVMLIAGDDDVPDRFVTQDQWGGHVMLRLDDGWCAALDRQTMLCTIYSVRPWICADYQEGEPDCLEQRKLIPLFPVR